LPVCLYAGAFFRGVFCGDTPRVGAYYVRQNIKALQQNVLMCVIEGQEQADYFAI
jgi:hypothetical protein